MSELADSTTLAASFVVTADDLVAMSRMTERDALPVIHISTAVVLAIGILIAAGNPMAGALVIGLGVALFILSLSPAFWRFWLTVRSGRVVGQQRSFSIDAAGIHERNDALGYTTPWTSFSVMRVNADGVFLLRDGIVVQMLPARAFASPYDVDRLIGLVSARTSNVSVA